MKVPRARLAGVPRGTRWHFHGDQAARPIRAARFGRDPVLVSSESHSRSDVPGNAAASLPRRLLVWGEKRFTPSIVNCGSRIPCLGSSSFSRAPKTWNSSRRHGCVSGFSRRRPSAMKPGATIAYALRVRGIPLRWLTEIERWNPPIRICRHPGQGTLPALATYSSVFHCERWHFHRRHGPVLASVRTARPLDPPAASGPRSGTNLRLSRPAGSIAFSVTNPGSAGPPPAIM